MNQTNSKSIFDDVVVKKFMWAAVLWAGVSFLAGLYAALELANRKFNLGIPFITFGRLRPLHTNAAIFAFAGNVVFAGIYHSSQRLLKTRMFSDLFSNIHFWGWQAIIVMAALTIPFGFTTGKEYAELEWPIDIAITLVWVVFAVNFFLTLKIRREPHLYVSVWFYIATIITVALLHVVNSIALPVSLLKSYPVYAGIQDALVQWWYGHNAVAFFLTTPFLGLMYYYVPKAVNQPVYSYRLSVVHFWTIVFMYIWAGPHHLLYTALPDWVQTLGMVFSVMIWIPSWGGMVNGLLTMKGAWNSVRSEPVPKFLALALTFYGMATFEGPLLSIKSVSALAHYTDWIIGHVHEGALGWNGFMGFAIFYYLVPKLYKTELYSKKLANQHFWIATFGMVLYVASMLASGITQGMMWLAIDSQGGLVYPDFVETVIRIVPLYWVRALGGTLYLVGFFMMVYNLIKTAKQGTSSGVTEGTTASPYSVDLKEALKTPSHRLLEGVPLFMTIAAFIAVLVGTTIELMPILLSATPGASEAKVKPYSPLELAGRDVYIKEGCYVCHSQMIRTMASEVLRYGPASTPVDSMYDHPFQWGSKRTGPDLARVGGKYPDAWHYRHMIEPTEVVQASIMPSYPWLAKEKVDFSSIKKRLNIMHAMGVPYTERELQFGDELAREQAKQIASGLGADVQEESELVALIAFLQSLGKQTQLVNSGGQ